MTFQMGDSYFHLTRADRNRSAYAAWTPNMTLLDTRVVPVEKQVRVFVDDTEYSYDTLVGDIGGFTRPTVPRWSYTPPVTATGGVACWGVRFAFDPVGEGLNDDAELTQIAVWDEDGVLVPCENDWSQQDEFGSSPDTGGFSGDMFDLDRTTADIFGTTASLGNVASIRFPNKLSISKVGWSSSGSGASGADYVENMSVEVNIGSTHNEADANWVAFGSNLTQDVGNSQDSHTAGGELTSSDYPGPADPIVPLTDLLTLTVPTALIGGEIPITVTIDPEPVNQNDKVTIIRETRQDRAWVIPTNTARAHPEQFMVYFDQLRFIIQEMCDLDTVAGFFSLPLAETIRNDYTFSDQAQFHDGGGTTMSFSEVAFLSTLPGAPGDVRWQLEVAVGNSGAGDSDYFTVLSYSATPSDETQYSVDSAAQTITLGAAETNDIRIRRVTRTDDWWYDPQGTRPGWNSFGVNTMQKQARFMWEESCYLPIFFTDHPLSTSIFPRGWNWFIFVGPPNQWNVGGPIWGGGGEVEIIDNDIELVEPTDYTIEFPGFTFTIPPTGPTNIGVGGGGFGGGGMGGGDDDEEPIPECDDDPDTDIPDCPPSQGGIPIDWPGFNPEDTFGIQVSIGSASQDALSVGDWEGGTNVDFSQGNASQDPFGPQILKVTIEVIQADRVDDGGGGFLNLGTTEILYINKQCNEFSFRSVATAIDSNGDGSFSFNEGSAALGCLQPGGAGSGTLWNLAAALVTSASPPQLQMLASLYNVGGPIAAGDLANVPFMNAWAELSAQSQAAEDAGVVGQAGFTWEQFQEYLDPDGDFTDFDIPPP